MLIGWVMSATGSSAVTGSAPALVVAATLPAVWIAFYSTLTNIEDLLAPLMVKVVARWRPGRVLTACEAYDVVLLLVALGLISIGTSVGPVLAGYLVASSPIPLVLDVAEELYGAEMAAVDPEMSFRFTSHLHSLTALVSRVVALPMGAALTFVSPAAVLIINLVLSIAAVALRLRGVSYEEAATGSGDGEGAAEEDGVRLSTVALLKSFVTRPLVSPLSILLRSVAAGLAGAYVAVFIGTRYGHGAYVWVLVATGVGATVGPQIARAGRRAAGGGTTVIGCALTGAAMLLVGAVFLPAGSLLVGAAGLVIAEACLWGLGSALIGERQVQLRGRDFVEDTVWCQAAGALGAVVGSWAALGLRATVSPVWALGTASLMLTALAAYVWFVPRRRRRHTGGEAAESGSAPAQRSSNPTHPQ
ncbi:MFS transporter [Actinomyces sp. MRS3W]|uniref:MFS transporter n=1 Tax=Actinomyces sp. MRS3W TaxID=2800796 RepID=UPI0028FD4387|nr:MFS transporter [Actinomyces sp. MRS3W]MDU0349420.1 MFS transporter [Actinomyces sp. MRS3W]